MNAIVFDLDDTLYDRSQPLKEAFLDLESTKQIDFKAFHKAFQINSEIAFNYVKQNIWTLKESHIYRIKETLSEFSVQITEKTALEFQGLYEASQQLIKLDSSIIEILEFLHTRNVKTYIITNGPKNHQRNKIKNLGLDRYFDPEQIIVSGEEGMAKPAPEIFELAESRFGLDKSNTWYVGDSYENDVIGASTVGWRTIWFNRNRENVVNNIATNTVFSTKELNETLFSKVPVTSRNSSKFVE